MLRRESLRVVLFLLVVSQVGWAWGCYAVIVGRKASADGSVLVGHLEQNGGRRILNFRLVPRQQFPEGAVVRLRRGGEVPQVAQTWAMLWSQTPGMEFSDAYMNEWGVAVVSDGCPTREDDYQTLVRRGEIRDGGIGWLLRRLVAQRARSAREGVEVAAGLLERFGYADFGRTYVIADPREAWLLAVVRGRHYVACRVADDAVVLLPNVHIVGEVNLGDRANWIASPRLIDYAAGRGWFDPQAGKPFHFARAYAAADAQPPDPRQWWGQQLVTGRREARPPAEPLPFSVRPERKMTVAGVMAVLRSTDGVESLSTPRTQEGAVFQLRAELPPAIGCVYWRAVAEPATSVFTPWYAGITQTPTSYCRPVDVRVQLGPEYQFRPPPGTFDLDPQLAWWTFKSLQDAVHEDYPGRIKRVQAVWARMETRLFADQKAMEAKALSLWKTDADAARALMTRHCADRAADACRQAENLAAKPLDR